MAYASVFIRRANGKRRVYARCGIAVLRALKITERTMRYQQFAKAIGLIADGDAWQIRYREQVRAILQIMAAVERQGLGGRREETDALDFDLIVNEKGEPGAGVEKTSRIVQD